jgi:hypothetical protein
MGERHGEVLESRLEEGIAENVPCWEERLFACLHRLHTLRDFAEKATVGHGVPVVVDEDELNGVAEFGESTRRVDERVEIRVRKMRGESTVVDRVAAEQVGDQAGPTERPASALR